MFGWKEKTVKIFRCIIKKAIASICFSTNFFHACPYDVHEGVGALSKGSRYVLCISAHGSADIDRRFHLCSILAACSGEEWNWTDGAFKKYTKSIYAWFTRGAGEKQRASPRYEKSYWDTGKHSSWPWFFELSGSCKKRCRWAWTTY